MNQSYSGSKGPMTKRTIVAGAVALAMALVGGTSLTGQSSYRAPRTADGKPDLQGIWQVLTTAEHNVQIHLAKLGAPPGLGIVEGGGIPYQAAALAQRDQNREAGDAADPTQKCFFPGVPRIMYIPSPFRIIQAEDFVEMFFEFGHHTRLIYTNGVPHHEDIPFWMGDPRGHWEGETFVVVSKNFFDDNWLDRSGNWHSADLELVERFTRTGPDHIQYEVTLTDPNVYTEPWKMSMTLYRRVESNARLLENECFALRVYERGDFDKYAKPVQ